MITTIVIWIIVSVALGLIAARAFRLGGAAREHDDTRQEPRA